jgi:hypothetical protein
MTPMQLIQPHDLEQTTTFLSAAARSYSAVELGEALGWKPYRAHLVLNTLVRRAVVRRLTTGQPRPSYSYIP